MSRPAWCAEGAAALGGQVQVDYPTDVGTVRVHAQQAAATWTDLPDVQTAAHCHLEAPGGATWTYVVAPGRPPAMIDRGYDRDGLYVRLGDPAGSPPRQ